MRTELVDRGREHAARVWAFRAGAELEAAARFERLAAQLAEVAADHTVIGLAQQAARDEQRHHRRCVELAAALGARVVPRPVPDPRPVTLGRRRVREQVLAEVVAMSCVTETLSAALLVEMRARARDEQVRAVTHEVLRDEVDHARLGWAHLAFEAARGPVQWLAPALPAMLAETVHEELFSEAAVQPSLAEQVAGLGALPRDARRDIFVATMEGVVLPGLERFGIDAGPARAWLHARISAKRARPQLVREVDQHLGQR